MNAYELQISVSKRLLAWGLPSILTGLSLLLLGQGFMRTVGMQAILWGGIDMIIASAGLWIGRSRLRSLDAGRISHAKAQQDLSFFSSFLTFNCWLDLAYIAFGIVFGAINLSHDNASLAGHGAGIIIQACFLFGLDLYYAGVAKKLQSA